MATAKKRKTPLLLIALLCTLGPLAYVAITSRVSRKDKNRAEELTNRIEDYVNSNYREPTKEENFTSVSGSADVIERLDPVASDVETEPTRLSIPDEKENAETREEIDERIFFSHLGSLAAEIDHNLMLAQRDYAAGKADLSLVDNRTRGVFDSLIFRAKHAIFRGDYFNQLTDLREELHRRIVGATDTGELAEIGIYHQEALVAIFGRWPVIGLDSSYRFHMGTLPGDLEAEFDRRVVEYIAREYEPTDQNDPELYESVIAYFDENRAPYVPPPWVQIEEGTYDYLLQRVSDQSMIEIRTLELPEFAIFGGTTQLMLRDLGDYISFYRMRVQHPSIALQFFFETRFDFYKKR